MCKLKSLEKLYCIDYVFYIIYLRKKMHFNIILSVGILYLYVCFAFKYIIYVIKKGYNWIYLNNTNV